MPVAHDAPAFWKEYLSSFLTPSDAEASNSDNLDPENLDQESLGPTGKFLTQLKINDLLKGVSRPPVPLPDPRWCDRRKCPVDWLENVYVTADPTIRTAALSLRRQSDGAEMSSEFLIRVNPSAFPPYRKYLNMVIAHEIAHLLFLRERPGGELIQYLNLSRGPSKARAEWLIHELAREVVAPTRLLVRYLNPPSPHHSAVVEVVKLSRTFGMPEQELISALLHSNTFLSWLRLKPAVRARLVKDPRLPDPNLKFMPSSAPHPLLFWAKSLVIILDLARGEVVKARKYIGKLWGLGADFTPDDTYQIPQQVRSLLNTNRLITQCLEWLNLANPKGENRKLHLLLFTPIHRKTPLVACPELGRLVGRGGRKQTIEVALRKIGSSHRVYILIRPYQPSQEGMLLGY